MTSNNIRPIVLRQYPSTVNPITSPKEVTPKVIYARTTPQPAPNPVTIVREPARMIVAPTSIQPKVIRIEEKDDDVESVDSSYYNSANGRKNYRKLLSGFHPYYDKVKLTKLVFIFYFIK